MKKSQNGEHGGQGNGYNGGKGENLLQSLLEKFGGVERAKLFLSGELIVVSERFVKGSFLRIDRSDPFNPAKFLGVGWSIWRGPVNGKGIEGQEDQDPRSLAITEIEPAMFCRTAGRAGSILLDEIHLDAKIAQDLVWEERQQTLKWLHDTFKLNSIPFPGTILRSPRGRRRTLWLCREGTGSWYWETRPAHRVKLSREDVSSLLQVEFQGIDIS